MIDHFQDQVNDIQVAPGMYVCDVEGDKIGSVAHLYQVERTADGSATASETVFEVKSGLFGLGQHYFVPLRAVDEMVGQAVYLSKTREQVEELGWDKKPRDLSVLF